MVRMATEKQIERITYLLEECGFDGDDYDFEYLSYSEAKDTIEQLGLELGLE